MTDVIEERARDEKLGECPERTGLDWTRLGDREGGDTRAMGRGVSRLDLLLRGSGSDHLLLLGHDSSLDNQVLKRKRRAELYESVGVDIEVDKKG